MPISRSIMSWCAQFVSSLRYPNKQISPNRVFQQERMAQGILYTLHIGFVFVFLDVFWIPSFSCSMLFMPSDIPGTVDVMNPCSAQRSSTDIIPGHRRENFQQFLSTCGLKMDHGRHDSWVVDHGSVRILKSKVDSASSKACFLDVKGLAQFSQDQCLAHDANVSHSFALPLSGKTSLTSPGFIQWCEMITLSYPYRWGGSILQWTVITPKIQRWNIPRGPFLQKSPLPLENVC